MSERNKLYQQYENALGRCNSIRESNSIDRLRVQSSTYNRHKRRGFEIDDELADDYRTYMRYYRNNSIVEKFEADNPSLSQIIHHRLHQISENKICHNCQRMHYIADDPIHQLEFITTPRNQLKKQLKFKLIYLSKTKETNFNLCRECNKYLTSGAPKNSSRYNSVVWPSFIWCLLSNNSVHQSYGENVWRFIPKEWRGWWLNSVKYFFYDIYNNTAHESPIPIFKDISPIIQKWDDDISSYYLARLRDASNRSLRPTILCPFGCTEFPHKCGHLPFDIVFQRYLPRCNIRLISDITCYDSVVSAREDYAPPLDIAMALKDSSIIFNPSWKILPSIQIRVDKGPTVLTCRIHNKGSKSLMIHTCRWIHNLPARKSDQLCQAVVNPRIIKPIQRQKYSTSFQMFEQRGNFNGLDTCSHASFGHFDFYSKLSAEAEARSIFNRPDIHAHLLKLQKEKVISQFVAESKVEFSKEFSSEVSYEPLYYGATFVPLESAMVMQKEIQSRETSAIIDDVDDEVPHENVTFNKYWSATIYPVQNMTNYGVIFPTTPKIRSPNIWILSALLIRIEALWRIIDKIELRTSQWHGWILVLLTKKCFKPGRTKQMKSDPFKYKHIKSNAGINDHIYLYSLFEELDDIDCVKCNVIYDYKDSECIMESIEEDDDDIESNKVFLFHCIQSTLSTPVMPPIVIMIEDVKFELRVIVGCENIIGESRYDGFVYGRHGQKRYQKWWFEKKGEKLNIQVDALPANLTPIIGSYTFGYVRDDSLDMGDMRNEFMKHLGGQSHVECNHHHLPLITPAIKTKKCACGNREYLACCDLSCDVCICKVCYEALDTNSKTYILPRNTEDSAMHTGMEEDEHSSSSSYLSDDIYKFTYNDWDTEIDLLSSDDDDDTLNNDEESCDSSRNTEFSCSDDSSRNTESPFSDDSLGEMTNTSGGDWGTHDIQREDLSNYVTSTFLDVDTTIVEDNDEDDDSIDDIYNNINNFGEVPLQSDAIRSTNAGEVALEIENVTKYGGSFGKIVIDGHVLLNQCGCLLTRKRYQIKGTNRQKFFLQNLCATSIFSCIPLMYIEGILFPSIHWKMADDNCSILGCIPAPLYTEGTSRFRIASIYDHIHSRLTSALSATATSPIYCSHLYDMQANLAANHQDTRLILNRGLAVENAKTGGLGLRGKGDSPLLETVESTTNARNLCFSQKHHPWTHFLTYTGNQKKHFGTAPLKNWIDDGSWKDHFPNFYVLHPDEQEEIENAIIQASTGLLLRIWEEVFLLFIKYLRKSESSPFKKLLAIFARREYQSDKGNLSHSHIIIQLDFRNMTTEEKDFVDDLIRASVFDIVRPDEVQRFIDEGVFECVHDIHEVTDNGIAFLPHACTDRCLVKREDGTLRCRVKDYANASTDNTQHQFVPMRNDYSLECLKILDEVGLLEELEYDDLGNVIHFQSKIDYFHPKRHHPPRNLSEGFISPVEGYTFAVCKSMQNVQRLVGAAGVAKYVCKYIAKVDEKNYIVVLVNGQEKFTTQAHFLHNTKVTASKIGEDIDRLKHSGKVQGRCIAYTEMLHILLRYPEIVTDCKFINISSMPLEFRAGTDKYNEQIEYVDHNSILTPAAEAIRLDIEVDLWRNHTPSQVLIMNDLKLSKISVDKITKFGLRPPELLRLFDKVEHYYRWFVSTSKIKASNLESKITQDVRDSCWIDGLQRQVVVRKKALPEIIEWCNDIAEQEGINLDDENSNDDPYGLRTMILLFYDIKAVIDGDYESDELGSSDGFAEHVLKNLVYDDEEEDHLPIPIFSHVKPTTGIPFIMHILLSLGRFETEIDLTMHESVRKCFQHSKLIGIHEDEASLTKYANDLTRLYIEEQLCYYPNPKYIIDAWIITVHQLFRQIIVHDEIPVTEIPPVQLSTLISTQEEETSQFYLQLKSDIIEAAFEEISETMVEKCGVPAKDELLSATLSNPLEWDAVESMSKYDQQSQESYEEQKIAVMTAVDAIDSITDFTRQSSFTKHVGIRGFPGGGKTWCMMYCVLYAISKGLRLTTTALMAKRSLQLGNSHFHKIFMLPTESKYSSSQQADIAILRILRDPKKLHFLQSVNILFCDEMGQISAELLGTVDLILKRIRNSNVHMGGVLLIFTFDHTQIQPIGGRPFLTSSQIIPCFRTIALEHSVRASQDLDFKRVQEIARLPHHVLKDDPNLIVEFEELCRRIFTFVPNWDDDEITHSTVRLYSKKIPAKEASNEYIKRVERQINANCRRERISIDREKSRYSHQEWGLASQATSNKLEQKLKEPSRLLFFRGAVYECTFNSDGIFNNSQLALLYEMPSQEDLDQWKNIKILLAPLGTKQVIFDETWEKQDYFDLGYKEVNMCVIPERTQYLSNGVQAQRKQYGLKHRCSMTIHAAMGDTLWRMATEISIHDANFKLWDKGQLIVILSRTKMARDTIFVGNIDDTIDALKELLVRRTQWTDYMEDVLRIITINNNTASATTTQTMSQESFPFRICDISLPTCNTGYVYMLSSLRDSSAITIHKTKCLRSSLLKHNSGINSSTSNTAHLRPYALFAYICGFEGDSNLISLAQNTWEQKCHQSMNLTRSEALSYGQAVVSELNLDLDSSDLRMVKLFTEIES